MAIKPTNTVDNFDNLSYNDIIGSRADRVNPTAAFSSLRRDTIDVVIGKGQANEPVVFQHNLNRIMTGYIKIGQTKATSLYETEDDIKNWTPKQGVIRSTLEECTVKLEVL